MTERVDVRELFNRGRATELKRERQAKLADAISGSREPEPNDAAVELDSLADQVADRILSRLGEPERSPFASAAAAKEAHRSALLDALTGRGGAAGGRATTVSVVRRRHTYDRARPEAARAGTQPTPRATP